MAEAHAVQRTLSPTPPVHAPTSDAARSAEPHIVVQRVDTPAERRAELLAGLQEMPAHIPPKFFYDPQGCAIYEAICALDEYYPPRLEAEVFTDHQDEIAEALPRRAQFIDLGCGDGAKAGRWLQATGARRYVGVDIAPQWLAGTLRRMAKQHPGVVCDGVVTDFTRGLQLQTVLRPDEPRIFFYPGSSIGNFEPAAAVSLLADLRRHMGPRDRLLIGADGPKPLAPLLAAYDDELGVTAAFNRNVLRVVNRELGSDFPVGRFNHRAVFNEAHSRIEMHLVAQDTVAVQLGQGQSRRFERGEHIVTEHSCKHSAARFSELLAQAGFGDVQHWTDTRRWYGVYVAAPSPYGA